MFTLKSKGIQIHPFIGMSIGMLYIVSVLLHLLAPNYGYQPPEIFGFLSIFLCPVILLVLFGPLMKIWVEQ